MYRADFPIERVAHEVWRAAASDTEAGWTSALGSPAVEMCRDLASTTPDAALAVANATRVIALEHDSSFAAEIAKLALANSAGAPRAPVQFARELFELTTEYLVSRDLSGFIGPRYRNRTVGEAAEFRRRVREQVGERVAATTRDLRPAAASSWPRTVRAIMSSLTAWDANAR